MTTAAPSTRFTPEDILELEDQGLFELVHGKLVEKQMSFLATTTVTRIGSLLLAYLDQTGSGTVATEQSFRCFPHDVDLIRRPDLAVIVANRLNEAPVEGHVQIAPDIAIEVASPNDKLYEVDQKLQDYRLAGVKLTWVVNPSLRTVRVFRLDGTSVTLLEGDTLTGEATLPGFSTPVARLFPRHM